MEALTEEDLEDDIFQTFVLQESGLRGRIVRMGAAIDAILRTHDYPEPVSRLLGEALLACVLLSSMLKYEGVFTLQVQGDGAVPFLVADVSSSGDLRGYARFDMTRITELEKTGGEEESERNDRAEMFGAGYIAFTVDQPAGRGDRYQGVVEIRGGSLIDSLHHYFLQSEQIRTGIRMAVGLRDGRWRAGAVMLQTLPEDGAAAAAERDSAEDEDDWRRSMVLMQSVRNDELLDRDLSHQTLLYRLFHEEGVVVFDPARIRDRCRCSEEKILGVLRSMPEEARADLAVDGCITVKCEFCSREYKFDPDVL